MNGRIRVEDVNVLLSLLEAHGPVEPGELELLPVEVVAENVEHLGHLAEEEDLVAPAHQVVKHLVQHTQLPTDRHDISSSTE